MKAPRPGSNRSRARATEEQDTLVKGLSPAERQRMDTDAWEPSLLRRMLRAQRFSNSEEKGE